MSNHTDTSEFTGSMFPFLSSICLVIAAIIIIFGIASISSLDLGKGMEPIAGGGIRVDAKSAFSETFPTDVNAAPAPADGNLLDADADVHVPPQSPLGAAPAAGSAREVGWAPRPVNYAPPGDEELQPESAAPPMQGSTTPALLDEGQGPSGFPVSPEIPPNPSPQNAHSYVPSPRANVGVRELRLRRECGPIKDRALRRSCIASFNIDYPVR